MIVDDLDEEEEKDEGPVIYEDKDSDEEEGGAGAEEAMETDEEGDESDDEDADGVNSFEDFDDMSDWEDFLKTERVLICVRHIWLLDVMKVQVSARILKYAMVLSVGLFPDKEFIFS